MAQYFTDDFSDFPGAWTERYNAPATGVFSVSGGNLVLPNGRSGDWCARTWDAVGTPTDVEILVMITPNTTSATSIYPLIVRGGGVDEAPTFWTVEVNTSSGTVRTRGQNGSADNPLSVGSSFNIGALSNATPFWIRLKVSGTGDYYLKAWLDGQAEPGAWSVSGTDTAQTPATGGWVGLTTFGLLSANAVTVHQLGVGTDGDAAPASAPGGSGVSTTVSVTTAPAVASITGEVAPAAVQGTISATTSPAQAALTGVAGSASGNIRLSLGMQRERGGYAASLSSLKWCVFNGDHTAVIASGTALTTDANGNAVIDVNDTSYAPGDYVPVLVTDYNAATAPQDRVVRTFFGFVPAQAQP